jgi:Domain of Unknown Function (DUF1259)
MKASKGCATAISMKPRPDTRAWRDHPICGEIIEEITTMRITALLAALGVVVALAGQSHADEIDWAKVDAALGQTASVQGDVHRYGIPRSDLQVTVDGVAIRPGTGPYVG